MVALPNGNGTIRMQMEYRGLDRQPQIVAIPEWSFSINQWYHFMIFNTGTGLSFLAPQLTNQSQKGDFGREYRINLTNGQANTFYGYNATWNPAPGQGYEACDVAFGTAIYQGWASMYNDTVFNYDIAWVHFFDNNITRDDVVRDANSD